MNWKRSPALTSASAGLNAAAKCPYALRRVAVEDPDTGDTVALLTNHLTFGATTIAAIYNDRWQIELLFKTVKQHLKIKTFVGTSAATIHTQIWTALIALLLLKYLQLRSTFGLVLVEPGGAAPVPALHPPGPLGLAE